MFVLRSSQALLRSPRLPGSLGSRSIASNSTSSAPVASADEPVNKTQGRRKIPTRRPPISTEAPRKWNRPIGEGVLPAYDLALKLIQKDSFRLKHEAEALRSEIEAQEAEIEKHPDETVLTAKDKELENMRKRLHILEVQSEINLPNVRWNVANALVDMTNPAQRHLLEQRWRREGGLDLLMERVYQMHVVPDVLPELHPSIDLHVTATALPQEICLTSKTDKEVEPGVFLLPQQTLKPPKLYANVFHADTRLYTMILVDLDVPDEDKSRFSTFLHWMKPNVPLSAAHSGRIPDLDMHTTYIPPHPQHGTPYHRYVLLLLPQPPASGSDYNLNLTARASRDQVTSAYLDIPVVGNADRKGFNVRAFVQQWGLDGAQGGGVHMFRQIWDADVSRIYAEILKEEEPRYGRPRKPDPYAEIKRTKLYT
ncbi:hypothetical protein M378DRAFT_116719 [Amanita muscaria Koide BX008]|uniref:PEBP-like protein n=1 Tax=Amanita muscaria (strain Koide BX008) TaxID=946122 RepID=A0A0C2TUX4_AMAMK|nr:hypothetical protein M378DRAFT_116719 [Amanita muscaria Koide BX008]